MSKITKIISIEYLTDDVIQLRIEKPIDLIFKLGQATEIGFRTNNQEITKSIFTIASLPTEDYLSFIIKITQSYNPFFTRLKEAKSGDEILVYESFYNSGIGYKGEGIFIAGGVGISPFMPLLKKLNKENSLGKSKLIFANRTRKDIIFKDYFEEILGDNFITILSDEKHDDHHYGFVTSDFIQKANTNHLQYFYLCGPQPMLDSIESGLLKAGVLEENIVKESF
ncbi:MAG: flavodoxin reductase [Brumimicrobium sp.]